MASGPISREQLLDLFSRFRRSAWHMETCTSYSLDYEEEEFARFRNGTPTPPPQVAWWQSWLSRVADLTAEGKTVGRIRVLAEPPTDYQDWQCYAAPWHVKAGEQIAYITQSQASAAGIPLTHDWWLFDDSTLVVMKFVTARQPAVMTTTTNTDIVAQHIAWRDLAIHAASAVQATA